MRCPYSSIYAPRPSEPRPRGLRLQWGLSLSDWIASRFRYRRFARGGHNLALRYAALTPYWEPHLEATRTAQRGWDVSGKRLLVLGAGRLLDFSIELASRFQEVMLLDADPACGGKWRELGSKLKGRVAVDYDLRELTVKYDPWQMHLADRLSRAAPRVRWQAALGTLAHMIEVPSPHLPHADAVLSLNVLSQLPIGWQEIVEELLTESFGKKFVKEHEQEWMEALLPSGRTIVEDHFTAIASTRCRHALVITDTDYTEYRGVPAYSRASYAPPPAQGEHTTWSALCNVELEAMLPGWRRRKVSEWTWHIAPMGLESEPYGTFHNVAAYRFDI